MVALFPDEIHTPAQGKSNEWYTPARYVEAAREVMGGIDLDPASCEMANLTVKAARYYSQKENGLLQQWSGKVWLNPPYSSNRNASNENRSNILHWVEKLVNSYRSGQVAQAILLSTVQTQRRWFRLVWSYPICFADHHVRFYLPHGCTTPSRGLGRKTDGHTFGSMFVYLGPHEQRFIDIFSQFGTIAKRVSVPKVPLTSRSLWETQENIPRERGLHGI